MPIRENVKLKTLYVNDKSGQATYFFFRKNNILYGARKEKDLEWKFATWNDYSGIAQHIEEHNDMEIMYKETIKSFWDYPVKYI